MTLTIDAQETTLPEVLEKIQGGDTVILTSGEEKTPVARMESIPIAPKAGKRLGFLEHLNLNVPDSFFFDPLPPGWDGESERSLS